MKQIIWYSHLEMLTQKSMAQLFDCSTDNISLHLKNIFSSGELDAGAVTEISSATAPDGKKYRMKFYDLDAIISVGYRINSIRATQFRQWATKILKNFTVRGYVLDKKRLENGQVFDEGYFEHLLDEIREIRASERRLSMPCIRFGKATAGARESSSAAWRCITDMYKFCECG